MITVSTLKSVIRSRIFIIIFSILLAIFSMLCLTPLFINIYDSNSSLVNEHLNTQLVRSGVLFGIARFINGTISLAQSLEFSVAVASINPLEILAPVNDFMERISNASMIAVSSVLLQKFLLKIFIWIAFFILIPVSSLLLLFSAIFKDNLSKLLRSLSIRFFAFSLIVAFTIPISVYLSIGIEKGILSSTIDESMNALNEDNKSMIDINNNLLSITNNDLGDVSESNTDENLTNNTGLLDKTKNLFSSSYDNVGEFFSSINLYAKVKDTLTALQLKVENTSNYFIKMLLIIFITTLLIPVGTFFILKSAFTTIFKSVSDFKKDNI